MKRVMLIDNCGIEFSIIFKENSAKLLSHGEKTNGALTNVLMNSRNHIMVNAGPARPRRLKRILVRGDSYLCRKSSTRFSLSASAQVDPISRRVLGNTPSDR